MAPVTLPKGTESSGHTILIQDLQDDRLSLRRAIPVRIDHGDDVYTAQNMDSEVFGTGATEIEALDDFRSALVDLYNLLKDEGEANLGPVPLNQWRYLRDVLKDE
ncbi:MAG: hypothetical protein IID61_10165 [SAR324 cluster bacterium]|nr:hypothetical protein [SAR324 cluster bacterium]